MSTPGCRVESISSSIEMSEEEDMVDIQRRDVTPMLGIIRETEYAIAPILAMRPMVHVSSESSGEEEAHSEACGGFIVVEEYITAQPVLENEAASPRRRINPAIFWSGNTRREPGEDLRNGNVNLELAKLRHADSSVHSERGNASARAHRDLYPCPNRPTAKEGGNAFGAPALERYSDDKKEEKIAREANERDRSASDNASSLVTEKDLGLTADEYSPTGLSDLSYAEEYPATHMTRMGSPMVKPGLQFHSEKDP